MRVQLLAAALGLTLLSGVASQVLAQETVPISEGASIMECVTEDAMGEMMHEMGMDEAMMEDYMMEEGMESCPMAEPTT